jgi:hypothetical protein
VTPDESETPAALEAATAASETSPTPPPHQLELAPSGRAKCRACGATIGKGELRFCESVPNPVTEGFAWHYFHPRCAADRRPEAFITLFGTDAALAGASVVEPTGFDAPGVPWAVLLADCRLAVAHRRLQRLGELSRAPSGRAKCRHCATVIASAAWRLAVQPIEEGRLQAWGFLHLECVNGYVGAAVPRDRVLRYTALAEADAAEVAAAVARGPIAPIAAEVGELGGTPGAVPAGEE